MNDQVHRASFYLRDKVKSGEEIMQEKLEHDEEDWRKDLIRGKANHLRLSWPIEWTNISKQKATSKMGIEWKRQ